MKRKLNSRSLEQLLHEQTELFGDSPGVGGTENPFLYADLVTSAGPWMALPGGDVLLDAAKAGGMLGFNAGACFGVAQYQESWTGQTDTETFRLLQESLDAFSRRSDEGFSMFFSEAQAPCQLAHSYIQLHVMCQFESQIAKLEQLNRELQFDFHLNHASLFSIEHCVNLYSAMYGSSEEITTRFCEAAVGFGILLTVSEPRTLDVLLNLSWTEKTLRIFWQQMDKVARFIRGMENGVDGDNTVSLRSTSGYFRFHQLMIGNKLALASGNQEIDFASATGPVLEFVRENLKELDLAECEPVIVSPDNWPSFRSAVEDLQGEVYEPARQTGTMKFDKLVKSPRGMGLLILQGEKIIAIAFAGPLSLFPGERGTLEDPWRNDPDALYMLDVTVRESYRGSLGRLMKQALTLLAVVSGCSSIHGRNRDRLAGSMWAINLSVGSFQIRHLVDDYPDQEEYRDCIYYRCPLRWEMPGNQSAESGWMAQLGAMSDGQMRISLARLANGYPVVMDGDSDGLPGNLVPVPVCHRRN